MSNAASAYYAYLARVDRERARVLRSFGYVASADFIDARAKRHERNALLESKEAPSDEPTGPHSHSTNPHATSDLHMTSDESFKGEPSI